jgi:signal transduction histidine kinase
MLPWRIGLLLVGFQVITLTLQAGIFNDTVQDKSSIFWFFFGIVFALLYVVIIVALVRSREKSERLVQELKAAQEQLKTAAIREKEVAILRERDRMAREMHDILGHALVLVAVKIEAAQRLQAVNPERAVAELEATKELVRQSMADLRASLAELRNPTLLDRNKSLALALQEWCGQVSREGKLEVDCRLPTALDTLQSNIQEVIWRVGREVLLNVLKHARARQAELRINIEDKRVILSAWDDGIGISQLASGGKPPEIEGHYGIRGMRERVMAVGGDISFKPNPGSGLLIEVTIPLDIFPANQKAGTPEKDWKVPAPERS